ncbi:MAG: M14 family zinc carboxypeptidase [Bacteroidia bacterium]
MKTFYVSAILVVFLFICSNGIFAQTAQTGSPEKVEYYKVSEVRISINSQSDIMELRKQGLGFENMKLNDKSFDVMLDSYQISILKSTGYPYEILIDDVTKDYLERTKESREMLKTKKATMTSGFGLGSMGGFYTFNEVVAQLDSMRKKYPNLITVKDSVGTSVEGRTIWAVKISDNPDIKENEPEVFYNSLIHGSEQQGMMAVLYFMYHLLENYGTDPEVTYLVNNRELYFMPVINPDGYVFEEQLSPDGGAYWRKNRRDLGGGIFGVNLARNFSYMWSFDNIGSSPNPQNDDFRGTSPFSEPESQAFKEFCVTHHFSISNSFHTYSKLVFPPWGYIFEQTPDSSKYNSLIKLAGAINGYRNGILLPPDPVFVYTVNGYSDDWMYGDISEKNKIFAVVTEASNPIDGHWPKPGRITPLAQEHVYPNLVYAWGPGIIENPPYLKKGEINLTYCNPQSDTVKFNAVEQNPEKHTSKVYAQIIYSKDSLISETLLTQLDSTFNGTLSFSATDENFYEVRYRQSGADIPSNLYYGDASKLKFTTAGPVVIDRISCVNNSTNYSVKVYLRNKSTNTTITKATVKLICDDAWVLPFTSNVRSLSNILPGATVSSSSFTIKTNSTIYPGYFNFKVEIRSDGYPYWKDSLRAIVTGVSEPLPQLSFNLDQNYPNPFNSITTIGWQLARSSRATLKVFDLVGREVAIPVDEQRPAGKYETEFNTATLPKGVYFYQLKAGEFSQTRKMVLLK